jgi:hypothetical protein
MRSKSLGGTQGFGHNATCRQLEKNREGLSSSRFLPTPALPVVRWRALAGVPPKDAQEVTLGEKVIKQAILASRKVVVSSSCKALSLRS